jgi:hypothetical protein
MDQQVTGIQAEKLTKFLSATKFLAEMSKKYYFSNTVCFDRNRIEYI